MEKLTLVPRGEILVDPIGHAAVVGQSTMMWCVDAGLTGISFWGRPTNADLAELLSRLALPHHPHLHTPCDTVLDGERLEGLDPQAFAVLVEHAVHHRVAILERMRRQALVRPAGLPGAVFSGFNMLLELGYEWRVFASRREALAWLDRPDAAAIADAVGSLVDGALHASPLVARLRAWLQTRTERPIVSQAAQALGLSARSLQRHLADQGTSYRKLVDDVAMARARALLLDTDLKIESIAGEVGFASGEDFIKRFRRACGTSPGEWRKDRRSPDK